VAQWIPAQIEAVELVSAVAIVLAPRCISPSSELTNWVSGLIRQSRKFAQEAPTPFYQFDRPIPILVGLLTS
jgi:hypothetical protein